MPCKIYTTDTNGFKVYLMFISTDVKLSQFTLYFNVKARFDFDIHGENAMEKLCATLLQYT